VARHPIQLRTVTDQFGSLIRTEPILPVRADRALSSESVEVGSCVDRHRILVDTGNRPDTVLKNAQELNIELADVQEVSLTHSHRDHVSGLLTLRGELMKQNPWALSTVHVPSGIFNSRPAPSGESHQMIAIRKEYEATGGHFTEYPFGTELLPGVWFTGPVPPVYPEHNWNGPNKVMPSSGLVEDDIRKAGKRE